jgi:hypothetical protein
VPGGDGTKYSKASQLIAATATKTAAIWITPARINLDILSADLENISVGLDLAATQPLEYFFRESIADKVVASPTPERLCGVAAEQNQTEPPYRPISRLFTWFDSRRMAGDPRMQTYRRNAEKSLELAQTFNDRERRLAMLGMANAWLSLAEQQLRNLSTALASEIPTPINEPLPRPDQPPKPPPIDEPPKWPPMKDPPPAIEPPPQRLDPLARTIRCSPSRGAAPANS